MLDAQVPGVLLVSSSQKDKRYTAQKRRMRLSGLSRTIYLFEGDLENCRKATTGADKSKTARTAEVDTFAEVSLTLSSGRELDAPGRVCSAHQRNVSACWPALALRNSVVGDGIISRCGDMGEPRVRNTFEMV